MSTPGIQACSAFRHDVAPGRVRFLLGAGLTRKCFAPSIRQNGSERKGDGDDSQAAICFHLRLFSAGIVRSSIYAGYILNVPFTSLLIPIALMALGVRFKFAAKNSRT